jgi:hypothetical protein
LYSYLKKLNINFGGNMAALNYINIVAAQRAVDANPVDVLTRMRFDISKTLSTKIVLGLEGLGPATKHFFSDTQTRTHKIIDITQSDAKCAHRLLTSELSIKMRLIAEAARIWPLPPI